MLSSKIKIFQRRNSRGFSLIEVLVALVLVGVALPALVIRVQSIVDNSAYMDEKTFAHWIAANKLAELRITQQLKKSVTKTRKTVDTIEYGGREWFWIAETEKTALETMYRINVSVGLEEDKWLASLSGFVRE